MYILVRGANFDHIITYILCVNVSLAVFLGGQTIGWSEDKLTSGGSSHISKSESNIPEQDMMITKWAYWASTVLLASMYLAGSLMYFSNIAGVQQSYASIGYPGYLVPILAAVKFAGAVAILWRFHVVLSDIAYAGMFYHLFLALSAHVNRGDGDYLPALGGLGLLVLSFFTQDTARAGKSPYGNFVIARA